MKKIKLVSILVVAAFSAQAQNISVNTTGAANSTTSMLEVLGIGTAVNSTGLYVSQNAALTGVGYGMRLLNTSTSSTASINKFGLDLRSTGVWNGAASNNIALQLIATGGTNNYALIVPASSGFVGIGTLVPTTLFHVDGGTATTTQTAATISVNSLTAGTGLNITSSSTAGTASGTSYLLYLNRTGVNANIAHNAYGIYSTVTNTNATSGINIGGYFTAGGATTANFGVRGINTSAISGSAGVHGNGDANADGYLGYVLPTTNYGAVSVTNPGGYFTGNGNTPLAGISTGSTSGVIGSATSATGGRGGNFSASNPNSDGVRAINDAASGTGAGGGLYGVTSQSGGMGVGGENSHIDGDGLYGINTAASNTGSGSGIYGETSQGGGAFATAGVWGVNTKTAGTPGTGVAGYVGPSANISGYSTTAVSGIAYSTVTGGIGVRGSSNNATGTGVWGQSGGSGGTGVYGIATAASGAGGTGVWARNTSTIGGAVTVYGLYSQCVGAAASAGTDHIAVYGGASGAQYNVAGYFNGGGEFVLPYFAAGTARNWNGSIYVSSNSGRLYWMGNGGLSYYSAIGGAGDYSEYFLTKDNSLAIGEVVALDPDLASGVRRARPLDMAKTVGVVSQFGTQNNNDTEGTRENDPNFVNVGMLGQIPVLVAIENGDIKPGDALTLSSKYRGRAVKAIGPSRIIGYAMTHFPYVAGEKTWIDDSRRDEAEHIKDNHVMCYLNVGWYEPTDSFLGEGIELPKGESIWDVQKKWAEKKQNDYLSSGLYKREEQLKADAAKKSASIQMETPFLKNIETSVSASQKVNTILKRAKEKK